MPIQLSTSASISTSQTDDVVAQYLSRSRQSVGVAHSISQSAASNLGRNRSPRYQSAKGKASALGAPIRYRGATGIIVSRSEAMAIKLTSMPPVVQPVGTIAVDKKSLPNSRLPKGRSQTLAFVITGRKLQNLSVNFYLYDLAGRQVLTKSVQIAPGGVGIDDIVQNDDETESVIGYIFLLPSDTLFPGPSERELKYALTISNSTTRSHLIEDGYLTFYNI